MHAIFYCPKVKELWQESGCWDLVKNASTLSLCELLESWKGANCRLKQRAEFLAWCVWTERNLVVFESKSTPMSVLIERLGRIVDKHGKYSAKIYGTSVCRRYKSPKYWSVPPEGTIKVNADVSLSEEDWIGMGAVGRDHGGNVVFAGTRRVRAW